MDFAAGSRLGVRGLAWDLVDAAPCGAQRRLRLRCVTGDLRGLEWDFLYPAEHVQTLQSALRPEAAGSLAAWRLHHIACLLDQVPGSDRMLAVEPGRIAIEPYQLVPLMRALEMPRPRLLLADGVGLGKTIQAGLIATELIARRRAHRILVVSPAGPLLAQWDQELRHRFGLRFTALTDGAALQRERRRIALGGNPFDNVALCLVALDFAKQERVLEELERACWDLAIIDEAHHCIGGVLDTEATLRRRLADVIARRSDGLLLLSATPHDGYDAHFASLIELLDPSLVDGRGGLVGLAYRRHVVRRLKSHIRDPVTGAPLFCQRQVIPVRIQPGRIAVPVQQFHAALAALIAPRLRRVQQGGDFTDALAFIGLLKRSVSTIASCVATLQVVAERYRSLRDNTADAAALRIERARMLRAYRRKRMRFGVLDAAAEATAAALEAEHIAADLCRSGAPDLAAALHQDAGAIVAMLQHLIALGAAAEPYDPKLMAIVDEVCVIRAAHPAANVLIYTEYADSQLAVLQALRQAAGIKGEVVAISGQDAEAERTLAAERFAEQDGLILISTDSLAEGLNLQRRCCHLLHLDLPYNPNRLEQRNGRIDRYGQTRDPEIRYLYIGGTFEERLLLRLIAKYEKARACLDAMPDTLGVTADEAVWSKGLVAGFAEDQAGLFDDDAPAIRTLDRLGETSNAASYRDLLHEIDRAFTGFEHQAVRHGWLAGQGLNADLCHAQAADDVRQRGDVLVGHLDLTGFVAAAIEAECGGPIGHGAVSRLPGDDALRSPGDDALHLPGDWGAGLDGLPGYDAAAHVLRITRDRDRLRDAQGEALAFLGRSHPLVRRAIARVRRSDTPDATGRHDSRVSAARSDGNEAAVLLTFSVELAGPRRIELQRIIAALLPEHGPTVVAEEPEQWLRLAAPDRAIPPAGIWQRHFAGWVPQRRKHADRLAASLAQHVAADVNRRAQQDAERDGGELNRWLKLRCDELCGAYQPRTADLFGLAPDAPVWKLLPDALDRLAAYAADPGNAPRWRREANSVVAMFRRWMQERADRLALSPPLLRPIGMLMLVPNGLCA